jgi:voltage-gated potassium channel
MAHIHELQSQENARVAPGTPPPPKVDRFALGAVLATAALSAHTNGIDLSYGGLKQGLRELMVRDPIDALAVTVLGGSYLFYLAEVGHNPKVTSYYDALVFISTNLSVGYADVFARTNAGRAIASAIMTLGPAMSGAALDTPGGDTKSLEVQGAILGKLDAILKELRASNVRE